MGMARRMGCWIVGAAVVGSGAFSGAAYAQNSGAVTTQTGMALGLVITLLALAAGYGAAMQKIAGHISDDDKHPRSGHLLECFKTRESCTEDRQSICTSIEKLSRQVEKMDSTLQGVGSVVAALRVQLTDRDG